MNKVAHLFPMWLQQLNFMQTPHQFLLHSSPPAKEAAFIEARRQHGSTFAFQYETYQCYYPIPDTSGTGYCFLWISLFVCIFVSLLARLRENGWTNLHEIFREGAE